MLFPVYSAVDCNSVVCFYKFAGTFFNVVVNIGECYEFVFVLYRFCVVYVGFCVGVYELILCRIHWLWQNIQLYLINPDCISVLVDYKI